MIDSVDRIIELIDKRGWTSYELAKQTGISTNSIYGWNNGAVPSLSNVIRVCEALDITVEQFFCNNEDSRLTESENRILQEWMLLSDLEKSTILKIIETFKILKRDR